MNGSQLQHLGGLQVSERLFHSSQSLIIFDQCFRCSLLEATPYGIHAIKGRLLRNGCFIARIVEVPFFDGNVEVFFHFPAVDGFSHSQGNGLFLLQRALCALCSLNDFL